MNYSKAAKKRAHRAKMRRDGVKGLMKEFKRSEREDALTSAPSSSGAGEDSSLHAEKKRARLLGCKPSKSLLAQRYGHPVGLALFAAGLSSDDEQRLWSAFNGYDLALDAFHRHCLGQRRFAKTAKIEFMPDVIEVRADDTPDLRSPEERAEDASARMDVWSCRVQKLTQAERQIVRCASFREEMEFQRFGCLTGRGALLVRALRKLADMVEDEADRPRRILTAEL